MQVEQLLTELVKEKGIAKMIVDMKYQMENVDKIKNINKDIDDMKTYDFEVKYMNDYSMDLILIGGNFFIISYELDFDYIENRIIGEYNTSHSLYIGYMVRKNKHSLLEHIKTTIPNPDKDTIYFKPNLSCYDVDTDSEDTDIEDYYTDTYPSEDSDEDSD